MKGLTARILLPGLILATASLTAHAQTYTAQVLTAGSSAQFGVFAEAAYQLAKTDGNAHHYTAKSSACTNPACAYLLDSRNSNIPTEAGNIWIVWSGTTGHVWAYTSVDSSVGVRNFLATPRAKVELAASSALPATGSNALAVWDDGSTDTALPTGVYNAVSGKALTAANTDIRPEDALYATNHVFGLLGYTNNSISSGNCKISIQYQSEVTTTGGSKSTAVAFALSGADPCSGSTVPSTTTVPVGAAPIVFIANKTNASGLGSSSVTNLQVSGSTNEASKLFSGAECDASLVGGSKSVPVTAILREPLSGTMNTAEFTNFKANGNNSQETGVTVSTNPLNLNCSSGGGKRIRGIGTGDVTKGVNTIADSIGYVFYSYEALVPGSFPNVKYLKLDGVDPLASSSSSTYTGTLPTCGTGTSFKCPFTPAPDVNFYNMRNGTYRSWSIYRMVTDASGTNLTNVNALASKAESVVDTILPDFASFRPVCGTSSASDDHGLRIFRDHRNPPNLSFNVNDGPLAPTATCTLGGSRTLIGRSLGGQDPTGKNNEGGGDVGGTINYSAPGTGPSVPGPTGGQQ